jgi:hypothetical protein
MEVRLRMQRALHSGPYDNPADGLPAASAASATATPVYTGRVTDLHWRDGTAVLVPGTA